MLTYLTKKFTNNKYYHLFKWSSILLGAALVIKFWYVVVPLFILWRFL